MSATVIRLTCEIDEYSQLDIINQILPKLTQNNRKQLLKMLVRQYLLEDAEGGMLRSIAEYICLRRKIENRRSQTHT